MPISHRGLLLPAICVNVAMMAADDWMLIVLGTAQDGGPPQIGHDDDPGWHDPAQRRLATSLGIFDRSTGRRWLIEATPDLREQLHRFNAAISLAARRPAPDGVFLTHA